MSSFIITAIGNTVMLSRENRVFLISTLSALALLLGVAFTGVGEGSPALVSGLIFGGVGFIAPQLYLAWTGADVPARTRMWFATLMTLFYLFGSDSTAAGRPEAQLLVAVLVIGLFVYEARDAYRSSIAGAQKEP
jgi:hypothetical protein